MDPDDYLDSLLQIYLVISRYDLDPEILLHASNLMLKMTRLQDPDIFTRFTTDNFNYVIDHQLSDLSTDLDLRKRLLTWSSFILSVALLEEDVYIDPQEFYSNYGFNLSFELADQETQLFTHFTNFILQEFSFRIYCKTWVTFLAHPLKFPIKTQSSSFLIFYLIISLLTYKSSPASVFLSLILLQRRGKLTWFSSPGWNLLSQILPFLIEHDWYLNSGLNIIEFLDYLRVFLRRFELELEDLNQNTSQARLVSNQTKTENVSTPPDRELEKNLLPLFPQDFD